MPQHEHVVQTSGGGSGRRESAPALLAGYENLLAHLKSQGALLNAVKPELLLDITDFRCALACAQNNAMHHDALVCCLLLLSPVSGLPVGKGGYSTPSFCFSVVRVLFVSLSNPAAFPFSVSMHACNLPPVSRSARDLYFVLSCCKCTQCCVTACSLPRRSRSRIHILAQPTRCSRCGRCDSTLVKNTSTEMSTG